MQKTGSVCGATCRSSLWSSAVARMNSERLKPSPLWHRTRTRRACSASDASGAAAAALCPCCGAIRHSWFLPPFQRRKRMRCAAPRVAVPGNGPLRVDNVFRVVDHVEFGTSETSIHNLVPKGQPISVILPPGPTGKHGPPARDPLALWSNCPALPRRRWSVLPAQVGIPGSVDRTKNKFSSNSQRCGKSPLSFIHMTHSGQAVLLPKFKLVSSFSVRTNYFMCVCHPPLSKAVPRKMNFASSPTHHTLRRQSPRYGQAGRPARKLLPYIIYSISSMRVVEQAERLKPSHR
jgi:hypothetical protein